MSSIFYTKVQKTYYLLSLSPLYFSLETSQDILVKKQNLTIAIFFLISPVLSCAQSVKDLTVLVYISARNNLALEALEDINEMEEAGSTSRVNFVAEISRIKGEPIFNPFVSQQAPIPAQNEWTGSRRFLIEKDSDTLTVNSRILSFDENADSGDWKRLADFIKWGKKNFPAEKYLLIVGGHGSGWRGVKPPVSKGIAYDDVSGNRISPEEMGKAIREAGGVDVYASDACLMQTAEFIYELKGAARYAIGSQESTPGDGYNYKLLFKKLSSTRLDDRAIADAVADAYTEYHFNEKKRSVTFSIINIPYAGELAVRTDNLARAVISSPNDLKLYNEKRFSLRNFEDEDARDLYQVARMYLENSTNEKTRSAARELAVFLADKLVVRNEARGYKSEGAWGISIYFPFYYLNYRDKYEWLNFSRDTYWDEMIKASVLPSK